MDFSSPKSIEDVVEEIMRIHKSLPARPGIEEVEAAQALIHNVESEDQARFDAIARQTKSIEVPEELFMILQEMRRNLVHFQSKEQKREATKLLDLENAHLVFDDLIQRASKCVPSGSGSASNSVQSGVSTSSANLSSLSLANSGSGYNSSGATGTTKVASSSSLYYDEEPVKAKDMFTRDDSYLKKAKTTFYGDGLRSGDVSKPQILDSTLKPAITSGEFWIIICIYFCFCPFGFLLNLRYAGSFTFGI